MSTQYGMQVLRHVAQVLILSATAHAWICSVDMTGSSAARIEGNTSATHVDASISCNGTQLEQSYGNFTVYLDPVLKDARLYGEQLTPIAIYVLSSSITCSSLQLQHCSAVASLS